MNIVDTLLKVHIGAGIVALATFLVPAVAAKGGRLHRRVGWVFVSAIAVLCLTGAPVSLVRLWNAQTTTEWRVGAFLFFLTILSGSTAWKGVRVLRFKAPGRRTNILDIAIPSTLAVASLWLGSLGVQSRSTLLLFFTALGLSGSIRDIRYWLNPAKGKMHWFFEHLRGMMGSGIATLTAFSALGGRTLGFDAFGVVAWVAPTVVILPISVLMSRYYERKFGIVPGRPAKVVTPPVSAFPA